MNRRAEYKEEEPILIDKPEGMTSFDVIRRLRRELGVKKIGHAGTLDPLASGLMLVGVGKGTKRLHELTGLSKTYEVDVVLGRRTTTGDREGDIVEEREVRDIDEEKLARVLDSLRGSVSLPVPLYSAVRVSGRRLYAYARKGVAPPERPERPMRVYRIESRAVKKDVRTVVVSLVMHVGSGVYVRSIAEEIGNRMGVPATVGRLRRISIGDTAVDGVRFRVEDARGI